MFGNRRPQFKRLIWLLPLMLLFYLLFWPVPIEPLEWTAPDSPSLDDGLYASNERLRGVQKIALGAVTGPEAIAFDRNGRMYSGLKDGRIVSLSLDGTDCQLVANTGGRPLGLGVSHDGNLMVADGLKGLLRVRQPGGEVEVLATTIEGFPMKLVDDLDIDQRGRVLLSDASWKFDLHDYLLDALEHGARGRLIMFDPELEGGVTLLQGLNFANGVALGPDESYVLVTESTAYRVQRYWLKGPRAGDSDIMIDALPGIPDNITFNGRDRFWIALFAGRDPASDFLAGYPFLRKILVRLPRSWIPLGKPRGFILGMDLDGNIVEQYQVTIGKGYKPITSVIEYRGSLYLGSLSENAIGRISLSSLRASGPDGDDPPPPIEATCPG